ncbi:hypothetical protein [uncultured Bradyrhizobium sp.]|uniref:hypothetical protein n=1 Tax=uncultured Bradyrhizobium sp. TaxID=199684 RepID=UPI0035CBBA9E
MALHVKRRRKRRHDRQPPLATTRSSGRAGSGALTAEFLDETISEWQPYSRRPLTREDAREIIYNVTGFMNVLLRWERAARQNTATIKSSRSECGMNDSREEFN